MQLRLNYTAEDKIPRRISAIRFHQSSGYLIHTNGIRVSVHNVDDLLIVANGNEVMILPAAVAKKYAISQQTSYSGRM